MSNLYLFSHIYNSFSILYLSIFTGEGDKLGAASTKLIRTLHWIFLESFLECSENQNPKECKITLDNVCLFLHLFAPLANCLKDTDLTYSLSRYDQFVEFMQSVKCKPINALMCPTLFWTQAKYTVNVFFFHSSFRRVL